MESGSTGQSGDGQLYCYRPDLEGRRQRRTFRDRPRGGQCRHRFYALLEPGSLAMAKRATHRMVGVALTPARSAILG
jgi:hypothetical protein